jgi:hypothetical protein
MLEKDPVNRISAESALTHSYFIGEMDIEFEEKGIFRELVNVKSSSKAKCLPETPSSLSKKKGKQYFVSATKENPKPFLFA